MAKKDYTHTSALLIALLSAGDALSYVLGTPHSLQKVWTGNPSSFRSILFQLEKRGVIHMEDKNNKRFIKLTKRGQLEALFEKSKLQTKPEKWDGKWRLVMFDIPEESHKIRDKFRGLLKKHQYKLLQGSLYVSPYPLNQEAVEFLKQSGLMQFIRIAKVEKFDDDKDLRKHFKLSLA